jgi:hypothetical protein
VVATGAQTVNHPGISVPREIGPRGGKVWP